MLLEQFAKIVGAEHVLTENLQAFLIDSRARFYGKTQAVLLPQTTQQVAQIVSICAQNNIAIIPQGGNSSHCGAATPFLENSIVLNLKRMNQILAIYAQDFSIHVQAGATLWDVQQAAAAHNRLFPLSLASEGTCQIGGNLATNAGGVKVLQYGNMRDLCLGLEVVLPNSEILTDLKNLRKNNTGYDLKQLFIGSEGTLGIITSAILKLFPIPQAQSVLWMGFQSFQEALRVFEKLKITAGQHLSAFEIINRSALHKVSQIFHLPIPFSKSFPWQALIEFDFFEKNFQSTVENYALSLNSEHIIIAQNQNEQKKLWTLRENISSAQKKIGLSIKHDIAIPLFQMEQFLNKTEKELKAQFPAIDLVIFGHLGDGNLHYNVFLPNAEKNEKAINQIVYENVFYFNGTFSAEHGIGILKKELLLQAEPEKVLLMRQIKNCFDPQNIMNPGKVL